MKTKLLLLTTLMLSVLPACDPPGEPYSTYTAIVTFPPIQHPKSGIWSSLQVEYPGFVIDYSVSAIAPAVKGERYVDTVSLDVNLAQALYVDFGVQQGFPLGPLYNEFQAIIYHNGNPVDTIDYTGPDTDFDITIWP